MYDGKGFYLKQFPEQPEPNDPYLNYLERPFNTRFCGRAENREYGSQITSADLSTGMFATGNDYIQQDEQVVIGSLGAIGGSFKCCCAIQIII